MEKYIDTLLDITIKGKTDQMIEIVPKGKRIYFMIMSIFIFLFIAAVVGVLAVVMWIEGLYITSVLFALVLILFITVIIKKIRKRIKEN